MKTCLGHCLARPLTYGREGRRRDRPESGRQENECSRSSRTIQILRAVPRRLRIASESSPYPAPASQLCPVRWWVCPTPHTGERNLSTSFTRGASCLLPRCHCDHPLWLIRAHGAWILNSSASNTCVPSNSGQRAKNITCTKRTTCLIWLANLWTNGFAPLWGRSCPPLRLPFWKWNLLKVTFFVPLFVC